MNFLQKLSPEPPPVIKANGSIPVPVMQPGITSAIETITPEIAKAYLAHRNPGNRLVSQLAVRKYAEDMREGRWDLTGQPIVFDTSGRLLDGHHRLLAATENDVSFTTMVVRNVNPAAVSSFDLVRPRSAGDIAHMSGVENARGACAAVKLIMVHERYGIEYIGVSARHPTKLEIAKATQMYPDLQLAVSRGRSVRDLMPPACGAFIYWAIRQKDARAADRFFEELQTGENLSAGSPTLTLRKRLAKNVKTKAKLNELYIIALAFKAWVAFRAGVKCTELRWRTEGASPEPFPQI